MAKRPPDPKERELWRTAMRDVKPLRKGKAAKPKVEHAPSAPAKEPAQAKPTGKKPSAPPAPPPPKPRPASELTVGRLADMDKRLAERLRRGQLPIEGKLDLHGLTQEEAHDQLGGFIAISQKQGRRCILVVTGKGMWREGAGILRENVPRWLNERPNRARVLAIAQAQPQHGGTGALYVLLKRLR
ncbi:MAG: Smr/MutS family protein [Dongiaceae bacterium]